MSFPNLNDSDSSLRTYHSQKFLHAVSNHPVFFFYVEKYKEKYIWLFIFRYIIFYSKQYYCKFHFKKMIYQTWPEPGVVSG